MRYLILLVLVCAGLAGCASAPPAVGTAIPTPGMPNPQLALNRAILRTEQAIDQMNDEPVVTLASASLPRVVPGELRQPIQWHYRGRLVPAMRKLAKLVNYHLVVQRASDHRPNWVTIAASHMSVLHVIDGLRRQTAGTATIEIDPRSQTMTVTDVTPAATTATVVVRPPAQPVATPAPLAPVLPVPTPALQIPAGQGRPQPLAVQ